MPSKTLARFDLTAELAKAQADHAKSRASRDVTFTRGGPSNVKEWAKSHRQINKGVEARAARDVLDGYDAKKGLEAQTARAILMEKAKYYEKLRKGETAGLTPTQISQLMVDFDAKDSDEEDSESGEEERDTRQGPRRGTSEDVEDPNDPVIEYQDEFGRTRTAKRSAVPRSAQQRAVVSQEDQVDAENVYIGDQTHFHVYEPTPEELAARLALHGESSSKGPLNVHYNANNELRDRGAAHRVLAQDEATRAAQKAAFEAEHARIQAEKAQEVERRAVVKSEEERKREDRMALVNANRQRVLAKRKAAEEATADESGAASVSISPATKHSRTA